MFTTYVLSMVNTIVYLLSLVGTTSFLYVIGKLAMSNKSFRYKVLLVKCKSKAQDEDGDGPLSAFSLLVYTVVLSICFYAFRYDSSGTYKPNWTNNLG